MILSKKIKAQDFRNNRKGNKMKIDSVEIMSVGRWNGKDITDEKLDQVIEAFQATKDFSLPVLKLGHNAEQDLLKKDGLPAAGYVSNVYKKGNKLLADFVDIPDKIFKLLKKKAYKKVSVELYSGLKFDGKTYPTFLGAVALLGADLPAMQNLNDILSMYTFSQPILQNDENNNSIIDRFEFSLEDKSMDEDLKKQIEEQKKLIDELQLKADQFKKENEDIRKESAENLSKILQESNESKIEVFSLELEKEDLLSPSLKKMIVPFLRANLTSDNFTLEDKKVDCQEWTRSILKLAKEVYSVNKSDSTENIKPKEENEEIRASKEIEKLMHEQKITYADAYRKITRKKEQ